MERLRSIAKTKLWRGTNGYTIIEIMIFLIISSALFGTVVTAMSQQGRRNQFTQSVDALQTRLQDSLNDVSTGYYPSSNNITCTASPTGPDITSGASEQGTSNECIFVGKSYQFGVDGDPGVYNVYTMVGNRRVGTENVTNLADSLPNLIGVGDTTSQFDSYRLEAGLEVYKVVARADVANPAGGFAIVSDFSTVTSSSVTGNASRVSLAKILGSSLGDSPTVFESKVQNTANIDFANTADGITICLREGTNGRQAALIIGGSNQKLTIERQIDTVPTECSG